MKFKKRKKSSRFRGSHTHSRGFKKKARGSGHRGGKGLAGTGKRADQKKTLVLNLYGNDYFGRDKALRKKPAKRLIPINLYQITENMPNFLKTKKATESKDAISLNLKGYKILGEGEINSSKKLKITASAASKSALEKTKKAGSEIILEN